MVRYCSGPMESDLEMASLTFAPTLAMEMRVSLGSLSIVVIIVLIDR